MTKTKTETMQPTKTPVKKALERAQLGQIRSLTDHARYAEDVVAITLDEIVEGTYANEHTRSDAIKISRRAELKWAKSVTLTLGWLLAR